MPPAQPTEWSTKDQAAELLGLSVRRVEELSAEHGWQTKKEKLPGGRQPSRLYLTADVARYKTSLNAPTLDEAGHPVARVKREKPDRGLMLASALETFGGLMLRLAQAYEQQTELMSRLASTPAALTASTELSSELRTNNQKVSYDPHYRISLSKAAKHIGLPRTYISKACDEGRLSFVLWRGRRFVRVGDVELLDVPLAVGNLSRAPEIRSEGAASVAAGSE